MLVKPSRRIFVALGIILFLGCPGQGAPQKGRVRCKLDASSAGCTEEKGLSSVMTDGNANNLPKADPTLTTFQGHTSTLPSSGDEYGSGNEVDPETGSGFEYDMEEPSLSDFTNQPNENLKLKLTNEGLLLHQNRL